MRVIVAAIDDDCTAHRAFEAEGFDHEVHICEGDYGYGELLTALWDAGEGFVIVEHDIVPWPGAIPQLLECESIWCSYEYPLNFGFVSALGCTKFSAKLIQKHPRISRSWATIHWGALDGSVIPALQLSGREAHLHHPPVAHVRGPYGGPH